MQHAIHQASLAAFAQSALDNSFIYLSYRRRNRKVALHLRRR